MSADVRLWPYEADNSHNVLWGGWILDDTLDNPRYIEIQEEYGGMTLPDIFKKWPHVFEKEFWGLATMGDGTMYLHGRVG